MERLLVACEGITVGSLQVPPFELRAGRLVCLHVPGPADSADQFHLVQALTGARPLPGLRLFGRVEAAMPPTQPAGLLGLFRRLPRAATWLSRSAGIPAAEAEAIVARLVQATDERVGQLPIGHLPMNPRTLLGLEAAWARGADAIVFTTVGIDPRGYRLVFEAVSSRLPRCAAIRLSYARWTQGGWERACFPLGTCVELSSLSGSASVAPA
jgi:hypothetical protein